MKITVDEAKCCAAEQRVLAAPAVSDQRDDGVVILLDEAPPESEHEITRTAAELCPATAMEVQE